MAISNAKKCHQYRKRNPGLSAKKTREYRLKNPEKVEISARKWKLNNPDKFRAKNLIRESVKAGRIIRPLNCSECGTTCKTQAHHDDYTKPYGVRFLCHKCHCDWHCINGPGKTMPVQIQLEIF